MLTVSGTDIPITKLGTLYPGDLRYVDMSGLFVQQWSPFKGLSMPPSADLNFWVYDYQSYQSMSVSEEIPVWGVSYSLDYVFGSGS